MKRVPLRLFFSVSSFLIHKRILYLYFLWMRLWSSPLSVPEQGTFVVQTSVCSTKVHTLPISRKRLISPAVLLHSVNTVTRHRLAFREYSSSKFPPCFYIIFVLVKVFLKHPLHIPRNTRALLANLSNHIALSLLCVFRDIYRFTVVDMKWLEVFPLKLG